MAEISLAPEDSKFTWFQQGAIPGLDGVRAVAVILVVVAHASRTRNFPLPGIFAEVAKRGAIGVDIFFVLSGFLITTLLLRENRANGRICLKGFYLRRMRRILPAYVLYLLVLGTLQTIGTLSFSTTDWLGAATYTVNFISSPTWEIGHVWSLSIEEHFYLLWPLALVVAGFTRSVRVLVFVICGAIAIRVAVLLFAPRYSAMTDLWTFTRIDTIATGCLFALLTEQEYGRAWLNRLTGSRLSTALIIALLVGSIGMSVSGKYSVGIAPTLNAVLIACLLWATIARSARGNLSFLSSSIMVRLGVMSYSIYLWQQLFLNPRSVRWFTGFPQNLALAFIAAYLSNRFIENRFRLAKPRVAPLLENPDRVAEPIDADRCNGDAIRNALAI